MKSILEYFLEQLPVEALPMVIVISLLGLFFIGLLIFNSLFFEKLFSKKVSGFWAWLFVYSVSIPYFSGVIWGLSKFDWLINWIGL